MSAHQFVNSVCIRCCAYESKGDELPCVTADMQPAPATEQATLDDEFAQGMLVEMARRGASAAGLSLAAQLFGVGACDGCGYRKLHCRCIDPHPFATQAERVQSSGSIDCLEFHVLLADVCAAYNSGLSVRKRERALIDFIDARRATASKAEAPAVACNAALRPAPASQHDASLVLAAELLEQYAAYIHDVKYEDIERHPYLPQVEQTAVELRAIAANTKQGTP